MMRSQSNFATWRQQIDRTVRVRGSVLALSAVLCLPLFGGSASAKATFVTFDVAGDDTLVTGINTSNTVTGFYEYNDADGPRRSAFVRAADGTLTTFDVPGSKETMPGGINDSGTVAGIYYDGAWVGHGFIRAPGGAITTFDVAGGFELGVAGISDDGTVAGTYGGDAGSYLRSPNGDLTTVEAPDGSSTEILAFNSTGVAVGWYYDRAGHGFVRAADGTFTTIDVPAAYNAGATGVNDKGVIAGWYSDDSVNGGFVREPDGTITKFAIPGCDLTSALVNRKEVAVVTCVSIQHSRHSYEYIRYPDGKLRPLHFPGSRRTGGAGITDAGVIAGSYRDEDTRKNRGFLRYP